jgi:hypothetical protein
MTQDDIHPAPEMSSPHDSKIGQNEKLASPTTNMVSDEVDVAPTSEKNSNKYAVDAFSAQREGAGEDYLDFRTMGWFQAGLVSTAEVRHSDPCCLQLISRTSLSVYYRSLPSTCDSVLLVV